jgi:hypothetical protein
VDSTVRLEVFEWGGRGRPLLFVGCYQTADVYDHIAPKLTDRFRRVCRHTTWSGRIGSSGPPGMTRNGAPKGHVVPFIPVVPDARHVPHQLAQGDGPLLRGKRGHVRLNLVVEVQPIFLQQQADRRRGERLGSVPDPEARARRDRHSVVEIRPAKAFGPHDVATGANRYRQAG